VRRSVAFSWDKRAVSPRHLLFDYPQHESSHFFNSVFATIRTNPLRQAGQFTATMASMIFWMDALASSGNHPMRSGGGGGYINTEAATTVLEGGGSSFITSTLTVLVGGFSCAAAALAFREPLAWDKSVATCLIPS
jgi:hypothetical protein